MDRLHEHQENIRLEEFASGSHANNPLLHCDSCHQMPSSRVPVPGPYSHWAVCFTCDNVHCQEPGKRANYWYVCKICRLKSKTRMKLPSHLKRHETRLKEHKQQAAALMLLQARELHDQDMDTIGIPDDDTVSAGQSAPAFVVQNCIVDRACSVLPSDIIKDWIFDYESKLTSPRNFFDLFPPSSERGSLPSNKNAFYFEKQHQGKLGPASVAAYALHHDRNLCSKIDPANVLWTQLVTYLGGRLRSATDRNILATVLSQYDYKSKTILVLATT
jgi:hypothetical protein